MWSWVGRLAARWSRRPSAPSRALEPANAGLSISDPVLARYFNLGPPAYAGVEVGEGSALGLSAVYRAVSLIAGTLAQLPLRTLRDTGDGMRQRMKSFLDEPGGPAGMTAFSWKETVFAHLLLHGNAFLLHVYGGAGQLLALYPVHPLCVSIELPSRGDPEQPVGGKWFWVYEEDGTRTRHDALTLTHVMGLSIDGICGLSVITVARNSLGTAIAGDRAAARLFGNGALIAGLVSADSEELDPDEAKIVKETIDRKVSGWEHAGEVAFINRKIKFTPWQMSAEDSQFLQSRQFSIEEVGRWFGVPPVELYLTEKSTSWGTGIESQQRGLARTTLAPWATRLEQALSRLLPNPRFVEFDFAGLERPAPDQEIALLVQQIEVGLLTLNEARAIRNMPPVEGGDVVKGLASAAPAPAPGDASASADDQADEEVGANA